MVHEDEVAVREAVQMRWVMRAGVVVVRLDELGVHGECER